VHDAVVRWAGDAASSNPEVERVGYIGSYARGDWGVGSDVDLIVVVRNCERGPLERALDFGTTALPVPADLIVYTAEEWRSLESRSARLFEVANEEGIWVYP
jgi:uncharacterized protein